jgi:hypothetical protein
MPKPKEKKITSRSWQIVLPMDFPYVEIAAKIRLISKKYYFVKHDRDIDDFGVPKKEHWHFLMTFANARDLSTMKNYFAEFIKENGEPYLLDNSFEKILSIVGSKKYLCHFGYPNKAQYDWKDVETNDEFFKDLFIEDMAASDEFDYFVDSLIKNHRGITLNEFLYKFKSRFITLSSHQRFGNILHLIRFYKDYNESETFSGQIDKTFTPVNSNYQTNQNDDLPF